MLSALIALLPVVVLGYPTALNPYSGKLIKSYRTGQCLSPAGGKQQVIDGQVSNGIPLTTIDCDQAAFWDINPGSGSVLLAGTNYALDAGVDPHNFVGAKVWQSYPGLFQQTWYLTGDNRIAITNGYVCLDEGDNGPQTYQCTTGNTNQIWYVYAGTDNGGGGGGSGGGGTGTGTVYPDPPNGGRRIHPYKRADLCVAVMDANPVQAEDVDIVQCVPNDSPYAQYQLWNIAAGFSGELKLTASNGCLFGGTLPSNGGQANIDFCGTPYVPLNWTFTSNGNLVTAEDQCLDVRLGSGPGNQSPYPSVQTLQTWACSPGNTQQIFFLYDA